MHMKRSACAFLALALFLNGTALSGDGIQLGDGSDMQIYGRIQLWNIFTHNAHNENGDPVDDRWDLYIRRGRFGMRGRIRDAIDYKVTFAYSNIGEDQFTAGSGSPQDLDNDGFRVWDVYFTWDAEPTWLNITMCYLKPRVGRENNTSGFKVNSMGKGLTSIYLRKHLVNTGPGRETGIVVGGMYQPNNLGFKYDFSLFDVDHDDIEGKPGGEHWAPMLGGRLAFTLGDPETGGYTLREPMNTWGGRYGTTLSVNYAYQGETDAFDWNRVVGVDLLSNYGGLNLSAEQEWLSRDTGTFSYTDKVYHIRAGYNIPVGGGQILEPAVMVTRFNGDRDSVDFPGAFQRLLDFGVNWYLDKERFKLNLHYIIQDDSEDRGDFLAFGVQLYF